MRSEWQRRRGSFNHDWLKNVYLTALGKWVNILDDVVEDGAFEVMFMLGLFEEWSTRRHDVRALLEDFESEMSPRRLLSQPPLDRCDAVTKEWLGSVVHGLWLSRVGVRELVSTARARLDAADAIFEEIHRTMPKGKCAAADLRPLRDRFVAFAGACAELAEAISRFPSRILVC